ncbi:MAG: hypothetical protein IT361_04370 [Gemmatimonadaceae bacterium]|nr:hypothetical protein [Gemmatimonadaceae bacterium]
MAGRRERHTPAYQAALGEFYSRYVWRAPVQADLDSVMSTVIQDIYRYMQGPSEFTITGILKEDDAKPFLPEIRVPVLFTVVEFDEANPDIVRQHATRSPQGGRRVPGVVRSSDLTRACRSSFIQLACVWSPTSRGVSR